MLLQQCHPNSAGSLVITGGTEWDPHCYFLDYTKYRESIALVQKIDLEILMKIHVLRLADSKKLIFGMSSVCLWTR